MAASAWARASRRACVGAGGAFATLAAIAGTSSRCDAAKEWPYAPAPPALSPTELRPLTLSRTELLSPDTKRYTFALQTASTEAGLPVASCLVIKMDIDGKAVMRPYTPVSPARQQGSMELIVKKYEKGNVSKALWDLQPGATVEMKGPFVKFAYKANDWDSLGMVAGGTGIAPMYQVLLEILSNPRDRTEVRLLYASRSPSDIILKDELDALAAAYPNFKVTYTVDAAEPSGGKPWTGPVGFVSKASAAAVLPPPGARSRVLVCGPPGFMKHVSGEKKSAAEQGELSGLLADLKYTPEGVFKF